jgi:hypothetical protein
MGNRQVAGRTPVRLAGIAVSFLVVCATFGLGGTYLGRGGGAHSCPAGSKSSDCSYPPGAWHWGEGLIVGSLIGALLFLAWIATPKLLAFLAGETGGPKGA